MIGDRRLLSDPPSNAGLRRTARRIAMLLSLVVALAAGSCSPPMESRFPLSEPGAVEIDQRLVGTWGYFDRNGALKNILQIARNEGPQVRLMLQWTDGDPPLYMTGFASEIDGMTIYNVRRVAGIGSDYTLMARDGCQPFSPAHEPGYMLFWATLSDDGDTMAVHSFRLSHKAPEMIERSNYTNELYDSLKVLESDPNTIIDYMAGLEEDQYTEYLDNYPVNSDYKKVYRLRRLSHASPAIGIPNRFVAKTEALLDVVDARYMLGDITGIAESLADIRPIVECRGVGNLDEFETIAYLRLLVLSGETEAALALAQARTDELRERSYREIAETQLLTGDIAGASRTRDHLGDAASRRLIDYFTAITAMAQGDRIRALGLLDRVVADGETNIVVLRMVADGYATLGEPGRAEITLDKAAGYLLPDLNDWAEWTEGCEGELIDEDAAVAVLRLIMLDRREAARPFVERVKPCLITTEKEDLAYWLAAFAFMDDPETARFLKHIAETGQARIDEIDAENIWVLHFAAAVALARAGLPIEAATQAAAFAQSSLEAIEVDEAEVLATRALVLGTVLAMGHVAPSEFLLFPNRVYSWIRDDDVLDPFIYAMYRERVEGLWRAVQSNPATQKILAEARQWLESDINKMAADEGRGLSPFELLAMVLLRRATDSSFVPSQLLDQVTDETEALASISIRVDRHTDLALTLALLGDHDAALRSLSMAHAAALEYPATGVRKHKRPFLDSDPWLGIH